MRVFMLSNILSITATPSILQRFPRKSSVSPAVICVRKDLFQDVRLVGDMVGERAVACARRSVTTARALPDRSRLQKTVSRLPAVTTDVLL